MNSENGVHQMYSLNRSLDRLLSLLNLRMLESLYQLRLLVQPESLERETQYIYLQTGSAWASFR